jgi:hypothetical protein
VARACDGDTTTSVESHTGANLLIGMQFAPKHQAAELTYVASQIIMFNDSP